MVRVLKSWHWFFFLVFLGFAVQAQSPSELRTDIPEYERLGLSLTEWKMVQQNNMSMDKVKSLLRDGISVSEYFKQPWLELGLTESQWHANRRRGLSDEDMRGAHPKASSNQWAAIQNFFVPGLHEWLRHEYVRASAMSGIAAASLALYVIVPDKNDAKSKGFGYPFPFLVILGADMLWSSLDIGMTVIRESNPDAARFSMIATPTGAVGLEYECEF
jgi:hypothetical protein